MPLVAPDDLTSRGAFADRLSFGVAPEARDGFAYHQIVNGSYLVAGEYDQASRGEEFRIQIARPTPPLTERAPIHGV